MLLSELGEFAFLDQVKALFSQDLPQEILCGIGDDCAVIVKDAGSCLLVSTDSLVDGIHFIHKRVNYRNLGYKSLAVNLSDIAAMGGTPMAAFLSLTLPKNMEISTIDSFLAGFKELTLQESLFLLGGDLTSSPERIMMNITVVGTVSQLCVKLRSTAKIGDVVCVTSCLGDSAAGLYLIQHELDEDPRFQSLLLAHDRPSPHLKEGQHLGQQSAVHAMLDVSDGIASDLQRICERSNVGVHINLEKIPHSIELEMFADEFTLDPFEFSVSGGEDYCLLLTVDAEAFETVATKFQDSFKRPLSPIGMVCSKDNGITFSLNGESKLLKEGGFDHFITK